MMVAFGLFSMLGENSSNAAWVCYQLLASVGAGCLAPITLPAVQASLDESDVATATGLWSFVRSFGAIWGVILLLYSITNVQKMPTQSAKQYSLPNC